MKKLLAVFLVALAFASDAATDRPNVVFILVDDLGVNDLSLYGSKFHETPHIDALAQRGLKFNKAYSASPLCSPTRSSILTGLYPARIGITAPDCHLPKVVLDKHLAATAGPNQKALTAESVTRFSTNYYTLAEAFRAHGYTTAHFGKWHLGPEPFSPLQQGFDTDIPHTSAPSPLGDGFFYPFHVWKNHGKPGDNLEDDLCDEAVKFIGQQPKDKPFFLNYWAFEVHSPWQAKTNQVDKYRAKVDPTSLQRNPVYAGMIETLDEVVGRIVTALDKAGVLENTVIVFTSDNGPYFVPNTEYMLPEFSKVPITSAQPLRAGKGTIYEAGTRVPLVVLWPGKVKPATETGALFQSTDFFPTFADVFGWKLPGDVKFDGVSQRALLEKNEAVRTEVFCHFPHNEAQGEFELMPAPTPATPASSVRVGDWKLIRFYCDSADHTDRQELYNLADDPGERHDLSAAQPERVKQLAARLDAFLKDTDAVIPKANPAYNPSAKPAPAGPRKMPGKKTPARALSNPFGVFNLAPFNQRPAQEQVDLAMTNGYDGLMASLPGKNPLARLREFTAVPAVREGRFKIYSILWQSQITKPLDEKFLAEILIVAKEFNAAIWCNIVGMPGERTNTIARLQLIADQCRAAGVLLVLYPHYDCTFETAEQALEIWEKMNRPEVKISIHLCHELKAHNQNRLDEVVSKVAPHLALASLNGVDTSVDFSVKGWDTMILPLDKGDYDNRPYLAALIRHGYTGPILLHNFGFKTPPEEYLPASMKRWREISADVAKQIATERAVKTIRNQ